MSARRNDWTDTEGEIPDAVRREFEALGDLHRDDPPFDVLLAARAEALSDELSAGANAHLEQSAWSRTLVDGAIDLDVSVDPDARNRILTRIRTEAARGEAGHGFWNWLWRPALAAAAIVLVAVAVVRWNAGRPSPQPVALAPAPSIPAPAPASTFHLPLEKPQVRLTAVALVLRGENDSKSFLDELAPGLNAFRSGDYAAAERGLAALGDRYPRSVEVPFYLGVSRLFLGDALGAIAALQSARSVHEETFDPDVAWYLAVADERARQRASARAELGSLCRGTSIYAARACDAMPKLGPE